MFIDTHCHLDDPSLFDRLPDVLANARLAGIDTFVVPGVGPDGWPRIAELSRICPGVYPAFGLHPMRANLFSPKLLKELCDLARHAVAIGEIGLDYLRVDMPRELQLRVFREQLRLAVQAGLPVLIHCRRAFADLLFILREEHVERVGGVMHAFSGSPEIAGQCIDLGLAIAVAGPVTYCNAVRPLKVVREIPLGHLLLETDAPDLAPEPFRGNVNEPAFLLETARKVAAIKGVTVAEVATVTSGTAERIFRFRHQQ